MLLSEQDRQATARVVEGVVDRGARIMLMEPDRMDRVLPGISAQAPRDGFRRATEAARSMADLIRRNHWCADVNALIARRQVRRAVGVLMLRERAARRSA